MELKCQWQELGAFLLTPDQAESAVLEALKDGYRLIDTANAYVNEKAVGRAMKKSGLTREDIFLETKIWPSFYMQEDAVEKTLERLDTDYIDLLLIHHGEFLQCLVKFITAFIINGVLNCRYYFSSV